MLFGKSFLTIFAWWLFVILCFISHPITSDSVTSTLSDGLISYTVSSRSDTRTWVITPAITSTTISITFENLNINQAELRIFETYLVSQGISIWSCASCGALLPPPFTSTTGSITITIRGVTGASFTPSYFRLRYLGIPANVTNLSRNISRTLNMGYASITPFAVSGKIPVNSTQRWELQPSGTNQITFMLSYFLFSTSCLDTLTIYNGNNSIIFQGCQPSDMINRWFYSTSSKATVIYTTKSTPQSTVTTTSSTFKLTYYTDTSVYNCGSFVQPETLNGDSVMFYDGSKSSELMRRGMDCRWRIASNQHNGTINLIFNRVSIKYGGSVVVYDGSSTSNTVLWNGNGATTTVPPIITSSGQTLYIVYISDSTNAVKYYGFLGEYYMNYLQSMGSGRGYTTLAMSSSYEIMPPGNLTMATTSNLTYTWYITPSIMLNTIWISFCTLQFTSNSSQLFLYDGLYDSSSTSSMILLGQFNNTNRPTVWYKTTGTSATLIYVTNNNIVNDNSVDNNNFFQLAYYADGPNYHCGFIRNPLRLTYVSWMITDGSQSVETIYTSQTCTWIIAPQDSIGLYLFFTRFSMWEGTLSIYIGDKISSTPLFTEITNTNAVPSFLYFPNQSVLTLQYITASSSVAGYGFFLTYFGIQPNKTTSFPGNQLVTLKQSTAYNFLFSIQENLQLLEVNTNLTYQILPLSATGRLYFALSKLLISNCDLHIFIYDSSTLPTDISDPFTSTSSSILTHLTCNSTFPVPYKWYMTTSTSAIVQFYSNNTQPIVFPSDSSELFSYEMSYYSDGNNYHCGFFNNPMILTAPSMIITDGSSSTETMGSDQSCTWIIAPSLPNQPANSSDYLIIWEFLSVDLIGGILSIYAIENYDISSDSNKELLYECIECSYIPQPIIIQGIKKQLYIEFTSYSGSYLGAGFSAVYWTTNATDWYSSDSSDSTEATTTSSNSFTTLLEVPTTVEMTDDISNDSMKYAIDVHPHFVHQLTYIPQYLETTTTIDETDNNYFTNENVYDGRPNEVFASQQSAVSLCGQVLHTPRPTTSTLPTSPYELNITLHQTYIMTYKMTQQRNKYLYSRVSNKRIIDIESSTASSTSTTTTTNTTSAIFSAKKTCQYSLFQYGNTNNQAILVTINSLNIEETKGRVRIYGGYTGNDDLLFDTQTDYPVQTSSTGEETIVTFPYNLTLPCGRGLILVEYINNTNTSSFSESYSMDVSYQILLSDEGELCDAYLLSLYPPPKKKNPYLPYIYAGIGVAGLAFLCILTIQLLKLKHKRGYIFYPEPELLFGGGGNNGLTYSATRKPTSPWRSSWYNYLTTTHTATGLFHPVYSPHYDKIKNYFLPKDKCCICQSEDHQVFMLKCHHNICLECTHSYLLTALGDISMFPVKCPMHYEGCTNSIDASIAKRIFTYDQYMKYLEFLDRAIFGDGMRCIFCQHFVNFPEDSSRYTRVECPYCTQKFCLRCKKPWHTQGKCPLDMVDESLEEWKIQSGAQKCPCCRKIIEKDDPDTCNHMVHRITDAIPCVRERTDFCYLCGEEVEADYPHDEVKRPGINHFPEGVFQKCRKIILKEREEEREKIRRQKRRKNNFNNNNNNNKPSDSSSNSTTSNRRTNHVVPYQQHDWEELSSIEEPPSLLFPTPQGSPSRPMPYNPFYIPEEEQQTTPTATTPATPSQIILNNFIGDDVTNNNTNNMNRNRYDQITDHFDTEWGIVMNQNRTLRPIGTPPNTTTSNNINNNINFPLSLTPIGSPTRQRPPLPTNTTNTTPNGVNSTPTRINNTPPTLANNTPNTPIQTRSIPRNNSNSSPTRLRPAYSSAPVTPQGSGRYTQQPSSSQTIISMTTNTTPNTSGQNSPSRTRPQRQYSRHPSTNAIYPIS